MFYVVSMLGDFPIEHQEMWVKEFVEKQDAKDAMIIQHNNLIYNYIGKENFHTIVVNENAGDDIEYLITGFSLIYEGEQANKIADFMEGY